MMHNIQLVLQPIVVYSIIIHIIFSCLIGDLLCCRANDHQGQRKAGLYGDYNCDVPLVSVESMLSFIADMDPSIDYVLWSGDNPPHDMWEESQSTQLNASHDVTELIMRYFPNTPVYPVLGNHEGFPANLYNQSTDSWLTDGLASLWRRWLDDDAFNTVCSHDMNMNVIILL